MAQLSIPEMLNKYLASEGLTQGQLAVKVHVNPSQVSNWISGKAQPSADNARTIARVIGRSTREVLEAAGYDAEGEPDAPVIPNWVAEPLAKLDEFELRVVEATARGLLRVREEKATYDAGPPGPADPE